ncbi:hypothetical protein B566_EDAN015111 [Ephemera danica]|nr:hypothetical protein B566_EDAN015111 [Ephemera danica]
MMSSPLPTLSICLLYAYCAKVLGPRLMENRKPFDLRNVLIVYNAIQTVFSAWIFYEPVDYSLNPTAIRMAHTCWWYYFSKFTEFFDTFFFILRKKNQHVSNLHVIHHGGHSTFFSLLNTFVHIIMYFYYMVAAMGPKYQKFIWWKKYLTALQMVQFVMIMAHQFQLLFIDCNYPKGFMVWIGFHGILFLFLFSDFYKASYTSKAKARSAAVAAEKKRENGVTSNYSNEEFSKSYSNCYSNGVSNGYLTARNGAAIPAADKNK